MPKMIHHETATAETGNSDTGEGCFDVIETDDGFNVIGHGGMTLHTCASLAEAREVAYAEADSYDDVDTVPPIDPPKPAWNDLDKRELIDRLTAECERAARVMRWYDDKPAELRAWAARIESGWAVNSENLSALALESSARAGREFLAETK